MMNVKSADGQTGLHPELIITILFENFRAGSLSLNSFSNVLNWESQEKHPELYRLIMQVGGFGRLFFLPLKKPPCETIATIRRTRY